VLFAPPAEEVYPPGFATTVRVGGITRPLEGAHRGVEHFDGVTTVVAKLLNMAGPDVAYFGQKDAQQALVVRRLVVDLDIPAAIEVCPTVREPDGLAMSSRNAYLTPADRARALALHQALTAAEELTADGEQSAQALLQRASEVMERYGVEPEYLALVDSETLEPVEQLRGEALLAVAAQVGQARLIDNTILRSAQ
jgi:pantoate--beta-alanine ligase